VGCVLRRRLAAATGIALCAAILFAAPTALSAQLQIQVTKSKARRAANPPPVTPIPVAAPILDATDVGSPLQLTKDWRVGITSDPAAATPGFDDSAWAVRNAEPVIDDVSEDDTPAATSTPADHAGSGTAPQKKPAQRFAWFRIHIKLAPGHGPMALLLEVPVSQNTSFGATTAGLTPDVFANGVQVTPDGPHGNTPQRYQVISRTYQLNVPADQTSLVLAVRAIYIETGYRAYTSFFGGRSFSLGNPGDLARDLSLWSNRSLFERLPRLIYSTVLLVLAIFLLVLYFTQRGHSEYLWLALHELAQAPLGFIDLAGSSARLDSLWYAALVLELAVLAAYLFFEFLVAFLSLRRRWSIRWLRYTAPIPACVGPVLLLVGHHGAIEVLLIGLFFLCLLWMLGCAIFIFWTLIAAAFRRNWEAALFLFPLVLNVAGVAEPLITSAISEDTGKTFISPLTFQAGPIPIHVASLADYTSVLAILIIIFGRFLRILRDQERATNELAAARTVQELLIPQEKLATPGFEVESVYSPANEVGGDFFHIQTAEGGMLIVIGDVAGKGLKAAMNVSLIMGAIRHTEERSPAKILISLNQVLVGTQSFTTCQAVWFGTNGEMVVANAGHLPPYLNSQEIALPGGLPLGVIAEVDYEESRFYLHPGDRVLLLSDGVVEARQPSGELFGFDRLRNFSQQSAFYLAEAAKAFGQQDDITVLTVRRQVQAMAA
jgi:phosphoserine phosphatase RsbU/P